jgi:hypothetical protein
MSPDHASSIEGLSRVAWAFRRYSSSPSLEKRRNRITSCLASGVVSGEMSQELHAPRARCFSHGGRCGAKGLTGRPYRGK